MEFPERSGKAENIGQSMAPRGRRFQSGFWMVFASKISPKSVFEPRNSSVKCISASLTQTQEFVRVGW